MNLLKTLQQPYPVPESTGNEWIIGAFVGGFLMLFQPFGIADWHPADKVFKILGFGAVTTVTMLGFNALTRLLPAYFAEKHWTVGWEIAKILVLLLCISLTNWLYMTQLLAGVMRVSWLASLAMTLLIGVFPTVGVVLINYIVQLRKYEQQAAHLVVHPPTSAPAGTTFTPPDLAPDQLTLLAENEKDTLTLNWNDLLAIESSDNYCTVFYRRNGLLAKELMRSSLSRLEGQLGANTPCVRCHRSYLVNLEQIDRVSGNAQGYKLHLLNGQLTVPVARKYNDTLVAGLK